jgi:hypothetical protein
MTCPPVSAVCTLRRRHLASSQNRGLCRGRKGCGAERNGRGLCSIFWIDPTYDIVFVGMVQRLEWGWSAQDHVEGMPTNLEELSRALTYQALVRPDL